MMTGFKVKNPIVPAQKGFFIWNPQNTSMYGGKNLKKIIVAGIIVFIMMVAAAVFLLFYRSRGSVRLIPEKEYEVNDLITSYDQREPEWKDEKLGNSSYTIGSSGCVLTCITSAISDTEVKTTPKELNKLFSEKGVYDENGNLQWGILDKIDGFHTEVYDEVSQEIVDECLEEGRYPIVRVRTLQGTGANHYVLIVGAENGEYICMDPLKGNFTTLEEYGRKIFAVRCVWYE